MTAVTVGLGGHGFAADEIIVRGSSRFDVAIGTFGGRSGAGVAGDLGRVLRESGYFNVKAPGPGMFVVTGGSDGTQVDGILTGPQGQSLFRRGYRNASVRNNVGRLADDIIEAIVGVPGINAAKIVFSASSGGSKEIFQCNGDGSGVIQLTTDRAISVSPSLSPKGDYIAYTSYLSGYPDIYTIDMNGRRRQRIVNAPGTNGGAAISPDGRQIACTMSFSGNKELYVIGRVGGRPRVLTHTTAGESSPAWSPDGREIVYSADQGGKPQLYQISASGGAPRQLSLGYSYCTEPSWSPDGNRLAFTARSGGIVLAVHDFRTGATKRLRAGEDPSWAPDSQHLAFTSGGSLYRINADTGAVKKLPVNVSSVSEPSWGR